MKRNTLPGIMILAFLVFTLSASGVPASRRGAQAAPASVQAHAVAKPVKEAKWFKVLVTYSKTGKERVRFALPISVIESVSKCVDKETFKLDSQHGYINLKALFDELRSLGPMIFVETTGTGETIKLWLE